MTCIEDLRRVARRKVPRAFFDYAEAGSYAQETLRANREDLEHIKLRQRVLVDVSQRDLTTTILGERVSLPLALAPIGLCGMMHGDGEILACRAAQAAGIPFTLSTMSICSIEDVAQAVDKPFWFQLYVMKDRGFIRALIERAAAAKCSALVLTLDLQVLGQRHCDIRNGMTVPPQIKLGNLIDIATKPAWALSILRGRRKTFGNLAGHVQGMGNVNSLAQWTANQFDPTLNWKDVEWVRSVWPGKLILKGILDVEDARIVSSNDPRFNAAALNAGRRMKFAPKAGRPTLQAQKPIIFTHSNLPSKSSPGPRTGSVLVVFSIGADGHVKNAHPEKPADPVLDRLAIEILSKSKFPPAKTPAEQAQKKRVLVTVKN